MNLSKKEKIVLLILVIGIVLAVSLYYKEKLDLSSYSESSIWRVNTKLKDKEQRVSPDGTIKLLVLKENNMLRLYRINPKVVTPHYHPPEDMDFKNITLGGYIINNTDNGFQLNSNSITDITGKQNIGLPAVPVGDNTIDNIGYILVTNDGIFIYDTQNKLLGNII